MGNPTTPEAPWPVRTVALKIADWVTRLGEVWVEGQLTQISRRPGAATAFLTLRDPAAEVSIQVTCRREVLEGLALADGARVVVHARPDYYIGRGTLSLRATEVRPVGIGELLARLERLKRLLYAEGLFAADRKRPLPFLPGVVGLVTGRASAAERDVCENAGRRWPTVRFRVQNVPVQGPTAASAMIEAIRSLDADRDVDVIVIARGGGSVEDLLPFSDEALLRAVAACRTAVVSAIGHEPDTPLLDLVADLRCSTPTDAGKRIVPDLVEEEARISGLRQRARRAVVGRTDRHAAELLALTERGRRRVAATLDRGFAETTALRDRSRRNLLSRLDAAVADVDHSRARVAALSPAATLRRGYAVVQRADDGRVVRAPSEVDSGTPLRIRLAGGTLPAFAGAAGSLDTAGAAGGPDTAGGPASSRAAGGRSDIADQAHG